jgi:hypothetical protein
MTHTLNVGARSRFVTVTAWVFIVLAALASGWALLQQASVVSLATAPVPGRATPFVTGLLLAYAPWVVGTGLALSVATLAAAVGLLWRLEGARRAFIGLLVLAAVANLLGLWIQHEVVESLVQSTLQRAPLPPHAADVFGGFVTAARVLAGVLTLGACALLMWIIRRLMSPAVRQEFA